MDEERRGLTSSGGVGPAGLAGQLSELARSLQAEPDVAGTLAVIVAAAVSNVRGADYAAITLGHWVRCRGPWTRICASTY